MRSVIYIWNFSEYSRLASAICEWFGDRQCSVLRSGDIDISRSFSGSGIESEEVIGRGFALVRTSSREGLAAVLGFDEWNIDVFVLPSFVSAAEIAELVERNAFDDSRGLGIESMRSNGLELISTWPYTIWLSFGAVDAKQRCLIRCMEHMVPSTLLSQIRNSARFLGLRNSVIPAQLQDGEMVECDSVPESP